MMITITNARAMKRKSEKKIRKWEHVYVYDVDDDDDMMIQLKLIIILLLILVNMYHIYSIWRRDAFALNETKYVGVVVVVASDER